MAEDGPWNKGQVIGRKPPLLPEQIQLVKMLLTQSGNLRDLALFSLAVDSSLRGVDLVKLKVSNLYDGREVVERCEIRQDKTGERVSFSMSDNTRQTIKELIESENKGVFDYLFTGQHKGKGKPISPTHYRPKQLKLKSYQSSTLHWCLSANFVMLIAPQPSLKRKPS